MSQPPNYPGRDRLQNVAKAAGNEAYQGAFEAIGSVLIACAFGYWVDSRWETAPIGLLVGTAVGFAAMVLRLVRLGKELNPDANTDGDSALGENLGELPDDLGVGESLGMSSILREDEIKRADEEQE